MLRRTILPVLVGVSLSQMAAVQPSTAESPADAELAGWSRPHPFMPGYQVLDDTLRAEVAANGRALMAFTRTGIERSCGRAKARIRSATGKWAFRPRVEDIYNNLQALVVSGDRLAWIGVECGGGIQLRYAKPGAWENPSILAATTTTVRAGMRPDGLVALATSSGSVISLHTARQGKEWRTLPALDVSPATPTIDHVAAAGDELLVLWHDGNQAVLSVRTAGEWSSTVVPGEVPLTKVYGATDYEGNMVIAQAADDLYVTVRSSDGAISEPELVAENLDYGCSYTCAAVEILPGGDAVLAWSNDDGLVLGRRIVSGGLTTEIVSDTFSPLFVRMDAHDDGSITLANSSSVTAWRCTWTDPCVEIDYPRRTDHAAIAAGPGGSAVAISGKSYCDDWCDFLTLGGFVYRPS